MSQMISLQDVAEGRKWCPLTRTRAGTTADSFAPHSHCIGPRCMAWVWRNADDAQATPRRRCHLFPPHFPPKQRVRLAGAKWPHLVTALEGLAQATTDTEPARAEVLNWARAHWRPEQEASGTEGWSRVGEPFWDTDADTVAIEMIRPSDDSARLGRCGLVLNKV